MQSIFKYSNIQNSNVTPKSLTFWYIKRLPTSSYTGVRPTHFFKIVRFLAHPVLLAGRRCMDRPAD